MIRWAILFFILAVVLLVLGFGGVAGLTMDVAWWLFAGGIILAIIFAVLGRGGTAPPDPL